MTESFIDQEKSCNGPSGSQPSAATVVVPTTNDDLDKEMAEMFYSGNISFNFAENPQFLKVGHSSQIFSLPVLRNLHFSYLYLCCNRFCELSILAQYLVPLGVVLSLLITMDSALDNGRKLVENCTSVPTIFTSDALFIGQNHTFAWRSVVEMLL